MFWNKPKVIDDRKFNFVLSIFFLKVMVKNLEEKISFISILYSIFTDGIVVIFYYDVLQQ